jgi:hypothetical protein
MGRGRRDLPNRMKAFLFITRLIDCRSNGKRYYICQSLHLPTLDDLNPEFGPIVHARRYGLYLSHTQHALPIRYYPSENDVLAIQERGLGRRDEELEI